LDPIGTPAIARDDVLRALDRHLRAEDFAEQRELRTAQAWTRRGGSADRAVVFDE
jgi:hypothetical protein